MGSEFLHLEVQELMFDRAYQSLKIKSYLRHDGTYVDIIAIFQLVDTLELNQMIMTINLMTLVRMLHVVILPYLE